MRLSNPLDDVLSSPAKLGVLRVLCQSAEAVSGREISRRSGISSGHVSRVLRQLEAWGVLQSETHGRVTLYRLADPTPPLLAQIIALFETEARQPQEIMDALIAGVPGVISIMQYGIKAPGQANPGRDTHLLVVVRKYTAEADQQVGELCAELSRRHLINLAPQVVDPEQIRELEEDVHPFWIHILTYGVTLHGKDPVDMFQRRRWRDEEDDEV